MRENGSLAGIEIRRVLQDTNRRFHCIQAAPPFLQALIAGLQGAIHVGAQHFFQLGGHFFFRVPRAAVNG